MPWNPKEPLTAWNYPPCAACDEGCEGTPCTCGDGPTSEDDHQRIVALESQLQAAQQAAIERGNQLLERGNEVMALTAQLAEANERCAGLAAALEKTTDILCRVPDALEGGSTAKWVLLKDACLRISQTNQIDPAAILAAVREKAKREGAVKELKMLHIELSRANFREIHDILSGDDLDSIRRLVSNRIAALDVSEMTKREEEVRLRRKVETLTYQEACMSSDVFCRSLSDRDERMKREGAVEALKVVRDYLSWQGAIEGGEDVISRNYRFVCNRIAELEAEG